MPLIITTELIKDLRDMTGISVMQCKNALKEAEGNKKKALAILKETSTDIALKKANRETKSGKVLIKIGNKKSILISLRCETDFVSKNKDFINLLSKLGDIALKEGIEKMKEEAKNMINPVIQKIGEKIELGNIYEVKGDILGNYTHNDKIAVIVSLEGGNEELAHDIAMHIAAMKPEYIFQSDITEDTRKMMSEIFQKEITKMNKPEDIKKKILEGKIATYFKERTLLDQIFIKGDETINKVLNKNKAKIKEVKVYSI